MLSSTLLLASTFAIQLSMKEEVDAGQIPKALANYAKEEGITEQQLHSFFGEDETGQGELCENQVDVCAKIGMWLEHHQPMDGQNLAQYDPGHHPPTGIIDFHPPKPKP